ncbi:MAG: PEP-CTERM sorting domain-containing protein, partial [Planctomycetota bacterium]
SLTYDGANTLTWQVGASHNYQLVDANFDPAKPLNYLQFDVVAREAGASVEFKNINLNGESLGDLASLNGAGWKNWYLGSAGLDDGFTLTGDLVLSGVFSTSQENNKLQVTMGHTAQVVPEPSSLAIFGSGALGLGLVALLRRRRVRG